jgi:hypothetical protein
MSAHFSDAWKTTMTAQQAYQAMYSFLEEYFKMTHADEIGVMLGGLSVLSDGLPADAGFRQDWLTAVQKVLSTERSGRYPGSDFRLHQE